MAYKIKTTVTTINKRRAFNYTACRWTKKQNEEKSESVELTRTLKLKSRSGDCKTETTNKKKPSKLKLRFVTLPQYNNKLLYFHIVEANVNCLVFIISAASEIELQAELYLRDYVTTL